MANKIVQEVYEELGLQSPDWIPDEYEEHINHYVESFSGKNQLPVKDGNGQYLYPINKNLVKNRVTNQLMEALMNCEEVPETDRGVEMLLTKNPQYQIMLNGKEERALCKAVQDSLLIENPVEMESVRNQLAIIAITFLSPRIKYVYRRFEKAIGACNAYEDVIQEMILAMLKMLEEFNFERTTAGITKDFMNMRMCKAINIGLASNRSSTMAQETWNKVSKFVNHPEDHRLSREEIKKKYHCSSGLVEIMFTFVENGSLEVSMDYTPQDQNSLNENNHSSFGDMIPAKDYSTDELDLDATLEGILQPLQYKVIKLKMNGYSHQMIADKLGFETKRKSQYIFICARKIIEREFDVDISLYSKGRAQHRKRYLLDEDLDDNEKSQIEEAEEDDDDDISEEELEAEYGEEEFE